MRNGIKEWAGVIDALGTGTQSLIIRTYKPTGKNYLLYPTHSYYSHKGIDDFRTTFKPEFLAMAESAAKECMANLTEDGPEIKYFVEVDQTVAVTDRNSWGKLEPYYIWTEKHVKNYAYRPAFVWILRIYKFDTKILCPKPAGRGGSLSSYSHPREVPLDNAKPVLSDDDFRITKQAILKALKDRNAGVVTTPRLG